MGLQSPTAESLEDRDRESSSPLSPTSCPTTKLAKKSKVSVKDVDWSDVTDPEERRRIQNRIAQRKFREKARENKERAERESRDREHAGNSYRIPSGSDFAGSGGEGDLSGLPWGGLNFNLAVSRGREVESRRSSGKGTFMGDDGQPVNPYGNVFGQQTAVAASYGSSGAEDAFLENIAVPCVPYLNGSGLQRLPSP